MPSVNKVIIVGLLGRDPEVRYSSDGAAICNISVATSSSWKDKTTGEKKTDTEWHRVVFYNRLAEIAGEYLKKGSPVYVEGRLKTRKWQDKDTGADKFTTEVVVENMQLIGGRPDGGDAAPSSQQRAQGGAQRSQGGNDYNSARNGNTRPASGQSAAPNFADMDDDIPF